MKTGKLWGPRFEKKPSALAEAFTSARDVRSKAPADERLIPYDLWGSRAHVIMLARRNILSLREARLLLKGLKEIEKLWRKGRFRLDPGKEDVHSNVESWLIAKYGMEIGGKLHTARSRNDQVALDMRLYLRDCALQFIAELLAVVHVLIDQGKKYKARPFPGYTHHQPAQVTTLGHVWLAFAEALLRDLGRFQDWQERFNQNPLGSMTGYGTSFPIDRVFTSKLLGFAGPTPNSLDAIQNRGEPEAEMGFAVAAMMNHLSSLAQTLILFSTGEFGFFELDEAYSSGSSMMPQKRNPDSLEVIKAKAAVAQGQVSSLLAIGRSQFLGYNRDTQWTKYLIMDLLDECLPVPKIMGEIVASLQVKEKKITALSRKGFITAPDLLEAVVQEGKIPFRLAKKALEKAILYSGKEGAERITDSALRRALREESLDWPANEALVHKFQNEKFIVSRRKAVGGTSPAALEKNITQLLRTRRRYSRWLAAQKRAISAAQSRLQEMSAKE